jgi:hypothetical protein
MAMQEGGKGLDYAPRSIDLRSMQENVDDDILAHPHTTQFFRAHSVRGRMVKTCLNIGADNQNPGLRKREGLLGCRALDHPVKEDPKPNM